MTNKMPKLSDFAAGWDESKHPRAKDGKFGKGAGTKRKEKHSAKAKARKAKREAMKNADSGGSHGTPKDPRFKKPIDPFGKKKRKKRMNKSEAQAAQSRKQIPAMDNPANARKSHLGGVPNKTINLEPNNRLGPLHRRQQIHAILLDSKKKGFTLPARASSVSLIKIATRMANTMGAEKTDIHAILRYAIVAAQDIHQDSQY